MPVLSRRGFKGRRRLEEGKSTSAVSEIRLPRQAIEAESGVITCPPVKLCRHMSLRYVSRNLVLPPEIRRPDCAPAAMNQEYDFLFNILIIGSSSVGKTCLLVRFVDQDFQVNNMSTVQIDCRKRVVDLEGRKVLMNVVDTAGQERYQSITTCCYRGAHGVIVAYDVTDQNSFNNIGYWLKEVDLYAREDVCKLLVGCKSDQVADRTVEYHTAKAFADWRGLQLFETSARDGTNVDEAFMAIATEIMRRSPPPFRRAGQPDDPIRLGAQPPARRSCCFYRLFNRS